MHSDHHSRRSFSSGILRSASLAVAVWAGTALSASADTVLKGRIGPGVIEDNVVIERNCVLNGTIIKGNVSVRPGAQLVAQKARIDGNVQAGSSSRVTIGGRTLVQGDVRGEGSRSVVVTGQAVVEGNIQLTAAGNPGKTLLRVVNVQVFGDVQAEKSAGNLLVQGARIGGNLQVVENQRGPYTLTGNRVTGDVQFFKNVGKGNVSGNRIEGSLQVKGNDPRPVVKRNIVKGSIEIE